MELTGQDKEKRYAAHLRWKARQAAIAAGEEISPENALRQIPVDPTKKPGPKPKPRTDEDKWIRLWVALQVEGNRELDRARRQCREVFEEHLQSKKNLAKHYAAKSSENGLADDL